MAKVKVETRADLWGVKPRTLASKSRRDLARIELLLERLGYVWEELESGFASDIEEVYRLIRTIREERLPESIAWLSKPSDADD